MADCDNPIITFHVNSLNTNSDVQDSYIKGNMEMLLQHRIEGGTLLRLGVRIDDGFLDERLE